MSRRMHFWLRTIALAMIVCAEFLPRGVAHGRAAAMVQQAPQVVSQLGSVR